MMPRAMSDPVSGGDAGIPELAIERAEQHGVHVIGLTGELDLATADRLQDALDEASARPGARVCLDLSALRFLDSSGLAAIIRAHTAIGEHDGHLVVVCVDGPIRRVFETTGLTELLVLSSSRASALRDLAR